MANKPTPTTSLAQKELDKAEKQFEKFDEEIKSMTLDRMNQAPQKEHEPTTQLSTKEIDKSNDIYLKPERAIMSREKFNERFRDEYNFAKEYVNFIADNIEIKGENIEVWTKAFPGVTCEFWRVPVGKPVWGPRYLAEQLKRCRYHRLVMNQNVSTGSDNQGNQYFGSMAVDTTLQRLDATPVASKRSVFMGAANF